MNYQDQLLTSEWRLKRESILLRDKYYCQNCNNTSFEKGLRCGFAMGPTIDTNNKFSYFVFVNVNSQLNDFPHVIVKISNALLIRKFIKIPDFIWIEYLDNTEKHEADICFIRIVTPDKLFEIRRHLKNSLEKMNSKNVPIISTIVEFRPPELPKLPELNPSNLYQNSKLEDNPYFNPNLISIGKMLPICFAPKLNVHHKVYRENKLAWEYPDSDLITLCWSCHEKMHKDTKIQCFSESGEYKGELTPCNRCFGAGWFPEYKHVQNGICFRCWGKRYDEFLKD
jgi:hypothetical protein